MNLVIWEPFIRVRKYVYSHVVGDITEHTKLLHYTDIHFDTPLFQGFLEDDKVGFIHIRDLLRGGPVVKHKNRRKYKWNVGFVYWKEALITTKTCSMCGLCIHVSNYYFDPRTNVPVERCKRCWHKLTAKHKFPIGM